MKTDLQHIDDVKLLVDQFYNKVQQDDLLAPIFNPILEGRWPEHLEKMYSFWQTVLLPEHTYNGYPFEPHAPLKVGQGHFERWLYLFFTTLDDNFEGENVFKAKKQAQTMAQVFHMRIQHLREQQKV